MQFLAVQRLFGLLLLLFSVCMLVPLPVVWIYGENTGNAFWMAAFVTFSMGLLLWFPARNKRAELRTRDGFVLVVAFWALFGMVGALPLWFMQVPTLSLTDAVFESMSGLSTTGATIITGLDDLPRSILFYRQFLQWIGGMGIVVLAVAVLPLLGVGGMQLYRAETPGPMKDSKLTPRIEDTARALWFIYVSLTIACALFYWAAGMAFFDAVGHSFSTIAIGGFSTHDASMGFYDNVWIEVIAVVFMLLAGMNFSLHFMAFRSASLQSYRQDEELRFYLFIIGIAAFIVVAYLFMHGVYQTNAETLRHGIFQAVSIATTTGFSTTNFSLWPFLLPVLLLFTSFVGGCAGSVGGGIKAVRVLLLFKQGFRELNRLVHPRAMITVKIGKKPLSGRVINAVWGFFSAYVGMFVMIMLLLLAFGHDQVTAFSAVAACLNNLGPGLGEVAANYASLDDPSKWVLCLAMLLGRLEIFTLLVLFTPAFWKA